MRPLSRTFFTFLLFFAMGAGSSALWAHPYAQVQPDEELYKRVKKLGDYGLLGAEDKAALDEGKIVTRLELAFYVEKAKARLQSPQLPTPVPQVQNSPAPEPSLPPPVAAPPPEMPAAPPPVPEAPTATPVPAAPPPVPAAPAAPPAAMGEIEALLKELEQESVMLRTKLAADDERLNKRLAELEKLQAVQDDVDTVFKRANKSSGSPNFNSASAIRFENIHVRGLTIVSASKSVEEFNLGVWSDLGGKGSISLGMGGYVSPSNASASPVSIYLFSPKINWGMDGKLGHWDANVAVEAYTADTMIGDFTRGNPTGTFRFEDPFNIKKYSTDKNSKNWDDYMTNLGFVPSTSSFTSQSNTGIVFDGLYMMGSRLPLVSSDARATILVGRMGRAVNLNETHRWEEGLKYSQPWAGGFLLTSFSTLWMNENLGIVPTGSAAMDSKNYGVDLAFDLKPFFLQLKGGFSSFYTGIETGIPNPTPYEAPAGQASLSFYPFTVYYSAISDTYSNSQSTVYLSGFNFSRFGYSSADFLYGYIGMVDNMISDRYGWRANLGWKGRQEDWMKSWPSFLDGIIVNFDVAQKTEYRMIPDEVGHNVVEASDLITVYYPDDTGLWGSNIWGGYGGPHPLGGQSVTNVMNLRNDGFLATENYMTVGNGYSQRVPFIVPKGFQPNGQPTTTLAGTIDYYNLDNLKSFNYITLTTKLQFNKMFGLPDPFYGSFFFTSHQVSGISNSPTISAAPDPNRPGQTLANIPNLFSQTVYDGALMYRVLKDINLMVDYGLERWYSKYTYPYLDWRMESLGAGFAYDVPWGGGKFEFRYKYVAYRDPYVPANNYDVDQFYSYFTLKF